MSIFNVTYLVSMDYMILLDERTRNFVLPLSCSFIIDIFSSPMRALLNIRVVGRSLRRLSGEIPQLHPPRLPSTANSTRELSRLEQFQTNKDLNSKYITLNKLKPTFRTSRRCVFRINPSIDGHNDTINYKSFQVVSKGGEAVSVMQITL